VVRQLLPDCERLVGCTIEADFAPTTIMAGRFAAGETCDVVILTSEGVDRLLEAGTAMAGSKVDLATTSLGIGVKTAAPKPDISTLDSFLTALRACRSVALSEAGASGIHFRSVMKRLGLTDLVEAKAHVIPSGFTGELAADGRTEWALQQLSELAFVPGVDVVGPLPHEIGSETLFSGAILAKTGNAEAARAVLAHLSRPEHRTLYERAGLTFRN
jgi:molybdate transport system substrate-binding protein